jgi:glutamine synthetase
MNAPEPTDDLATLFHREGVRDVECLFADVTGYPRGKLMPAQRFAQGQELRIAQAVPMQCVTGQYSYDPIFPDADPDVRLVPDPATLRRVPWSSVPRYLALHDCVETDGRPCAFAPRSVLQSVLERYRAQGLTPVVAPEIEFYLVAAHVDPAQPLQAPPGRSGRAESGHSAFSLNQLNELAPFWDEFHAALDTLQIATDTWIHEVGATQYEINLQHGNALAVADQAFLFKFAAKEVALRHGLNAVFMAKPMAGQPGSSMHLHQSVVDADGHNVFSRSDGSASPRHGQFIAGLQAYTPELMLMHAPSVNSFRRYVAGSQAPVNLHWGHDKAAHGALRSVVVRACRHRREDLGRPAPGCDCGAPLRGVRCAARSIRGLANNSASPGRAAAQPTREPDLGHDSLDGSPCGDPQPAEALRSSAPHTQPGAGRPRSLETRVAHHLPACHPGSSRQAVPGGGDLWVAEDHSTMGGAPQARFVL